MSETLVEGPARVVIRYQPAEDADQGPISLPGYLNAQPSIVRPGDRFVVDGGEVENLTASDRFVVEEIAAEDLPSPNADLSREELIAKIGLDADAVPAHVDDAELVEAADTLDRVRPLPPGYASDELAGDTVAPADEDDSQVDELVDAGMSADPVDPDPADEQAQPVDGNPPPPDPAGLGTGTTDPEGSDQ